MLAPCPEQECATGASALNSGSNSSTRSASDDLRRFRLENFVTSSKDLRWCPGAGCDKIVRSGAACTSSSARSPMAAAAAAFCASCGEEAHQPAGCPALAEWAEKCQNERDGELDPGQHEALPEVPDAHREEPGLQPHVLLAVQVRVLLDVHGRLARGVPFRY